MSSRNLADLRQDVRQMAEKHIELCKEQKIDLLVYCTYRSNEEQDELYAQGRTKPGKIVTNARGGQSQHNNVDSAKRPSALGYDCVPLKNGKAVWDGKDQLWVTVIKCGEEAGLQASARWSGKLKEQCHFGI
jgi:peptidoglycan L-alanyl-D-glutamate endopeptidase CwlK